MTKPRRNKADSPTMTRRRFVFASIGASMTVPLVLKGCGTPAVDPVDTLDPETWEQGTLVTWSPAEIAIDTALFPVGLHVGGMRLTSAIFWGYSPDPQTKRLKVWREAQEPSQVILVADLEVESVEGYIKYEVSGLAPQTRYSYAFFESDESVRSDIASFRMPHHEESMEPVTVAATTCTNFNRMPYTSLQTTAKFDFDVFCQLGDMSYNDGAVTREEFRSRWLATLDDPGYRAVMHQAGIYATLDDHEVSDDSDRYGLPKEVYQTGIESFFEALAVPEVQKGRLWDSFRWGKTVEFFVLDCRTEREPASSFSDNQVYISQEQMDWLKQGLTDSPCMFKVILNSVPIMGFADVWPELLDRWQAFPDQRDELLDHIIDGAIEQVFFLTGDYHMAYAGRVEPSGSKSAIWELMVGPGAPRVPNPLMGVLEVDPSAIPEFFPPEQFNYFSNRPAATLITFDPAKETAKVVYVDHETEEVLYEEELHARLG
jgi:phosphodiesterase/alkaline phosphatase D-like protein